MRTLTIKRRKKFAACLGKMKIYIEDPVACDLVMQVYVKNPETGELVLTDVPCRRLGTLKNGEEKSFQISEAPARVFVIADQLSKNYCRDMACIPAGEEDVVLCGQNYFNPATGNAFRFDGAPSPEAEALRHRSVGKGTVVLVVALIVGILLGFAITTALRLASISGEVVHTVEDMQITLPGNLKEIDESGFTACYDGRDMAVYILEEKFSLDPKLKGYTLTQYGEAVIENNDFASSPKLKAGDGYLYFEYDWTNEELDQELHYYVALYKESDAFWMITFAARAEDFEELRDKVVSSSKSVEFDK